MAEAARRIRSGERGPLWLTAERQTGGRGRRGRAWRSADADLKATLVLDPAELRAGTTPGAAATLGFALGLALVDALGAVGLAAPLRLKWPNDLLLGGAKLAGILLEAHGPTAAPTLALGIGVNIVSAPPAAALEPGALPATALAAHMTPPPSAAELLAALDAALAVRLETWAREGFEGLRGAWLAHAAGLGESIAARAGAERLTGRFADVDAEGALVLETDRGIRRLFAADVYFGEAPA